MATFERSCDNCRRLKIRCDRGKPCCKNCNKRQVSCTRNKPLQKRGPKPKFASSKLKMLISARRQRLLLECGSPPDVTSEEEDEISDYSDYTEESTTSSGGDSFSEAELYSDEYYVQSYPFEAETESKPEIFLQCPMNMSSMFSHTDADSRIDAPQTVSTTIQGDLARFEKELRKMVPDSLNEQQATLLSYYFTNVQPQLPLISPQKFLTLTTAFPDDASFQSNMKLLVGALCQVTYLFSLSPSLFHHSILTFLVQSNLDILFSPEAALPKLPHILTNALVMLIRYHLAATSV
ncbi:hypothetical protein DSO57_1029036 [Entomophthora muscae]|uniref:Uncharacterized protein n=1 Tax=Entomophthora muscae TaxID=34485 RepID=A0ACC2TNB8_9FUNG|nr:hypothetical protein DSO57_1029036 [Entomophthora muscae]